MWGYVEALGIAGYAPGISWWVNRGIIVKEFVEAAILLSNNRDFVEASKELGWVNCEVRVIVPMRVICAERPCRVVFNAMESNRVIIRVEGHSANDILEPSLGGEDKVNKVRWDVNGSSVQWC